MTTPAPLRIELVTDPARLAALAPDWTALQQRAGACVFQSHGWISAWWRSLPERRTLALRIGLAWEGSDLVGIMPLVLRRSFGLRVLEWAAKASSDYCDILVAPGSARARIVNALWEVVSDGISFDAAYLGHLAPDAAALMLRAAGGRVGLGPSGRRQVNLRIRKAWPDGATWLAAQPKKFRQNHRRGWKQLADSGQAAFRLVGPDEPRTAILDRLVALKRDWLARTGQSSTVLAEDGAMLRAAIGALAEQGLLRLFVIEIDGRVVAGTATFLEGGRLGALFAAYDEAYERASVGTLLMADYICWAFDRGIAEIDFLAGAEPYKLKFADTSQDLVGLAGAKTWRGRIALAADGVATRIRARRAAAAAVRSEAPPATPRKLSPRSAG